MIVKAMNRWHMIEVDLAVTLAVAGGVQVLPRTWTKPLVSDCHSMSPNNSTAMRWRSERLTSPLAIELRFLRLWQRSSSVAFSLT